MVGGRNMSKTIYFSAQGCNGKTRPADDIDGFVGTTTGWGSNMNYRKTQLSTNRPDLELMSAQEKEPGQQYQEVEIGRRIRVGWAAYGNLNYIFNANIPNYAKSKSFCTACAHVRLPDLNNKQNDKKLSVSTSENHGMTTLWNVLRRQWSLRKTTKQIYG